MKLAAAAILLVAVSALDAQVSGGRVARAAGPSTGGARPAHVYPGHFYPGHVHGAVVVGAAFVGVGYWPGYYYPPAYYAPPPVYYAPPPPPASYWYYCAQLNAYYPYVPSCPGPWQPVPATPYTN